MTRGEVEGVALGVALRDVLVRALAGGLGEGSMGKLFAWFGAARLLRQTGQDGVSGRNLMAHPAWRLWRQANLRHISPDTIGSKHMQQISALLADSSVSLKITVRSSTARSASTSNVIERCRVFAYSISREPKHTSSSSFTSGLSMLPRVMGTPFGDCTSMRAVVDCSRCHMSVAVDGCTQGKGERVPKRKRQLLSSPAVHTPRTSDTRINCLSTLGDSLQPDHRSCGNSRVPSTSAKGVTIVTFIFIQLIFCLARSLFRLEASFIKASASSAFLLASAGEMQPGWGCGSSGRPAAFGRTWACTVLPLATPYFQSGKPGSSCRPLKTKRNPATAVSPSRSAKAFARPAASEPRSTKTPTLRPARFLTKSCCTSAESIMMAWTSG